jgi:hypothetical protein
MLKIGNQALIDMMKAVASIPDHEKTVFLYKVDRIVHVQLSNIYNREHAAELKAAAAKRAIAAEKRAIAAAERAIAAEKAAAFERAGLHNMMFIEWTFRRDDAGVLQVVVPKTLDDHTKKRLHRKACAADHEPTVRWLVKTYGCNRNDYNRTRMYVKRHNKDSAALAWLGQHTTRVSKLARE